MEFLIFSVLSIVTGRLRYGVYFGSINVSHKMVDLIAILRALERHLRVGFDDEHV
jgi:hypothetical protein